MIDRQSCDLRNRIAEVCKRVRRDPKEVGLVLVTKEVELERIREAYELGVRDFGENRVQELLEKRDQLPQDIRWHFIGSLQMNKVKFLAENVFLIHSCDRIELAKEIQKQAEKHNRILEVLVQVNTSGEETKHGFSPEAIKGAVSEIIQLDRIKLRGLMTIGPNTEDKAKSRSAFRVLRFLRDELKNGFPNQDWRYLSMGMSSDFEIAVEEGANLLRIGTAVFGPRT